MGTYAMKCVAAALILRVRGFTYAKRTDDRADYCRGTEVSNHSLILSRALVLTNSRELPTVSREPHDFQKLNECRNLHPVATCSLR